jgi:hypothetical protein
MSHPYMSVEEIADLCYAIWWDLCYAGKTRIGQRNHEGVQAIVLWSSCLAMRPGWGRSQWESLLSDLRREQ